METTKIQRLSIFIKDDVFIFNLITKISGVVSWFVFSEFTRIISSVPVKFAFWPLRRKFVYFPTIFHFDVSFSTSHFKFSSAHVSLSLYSDHISRSIPLIFQSVIFPVFAACGRVLFQLQFSHNKHFNLLLF